MNDSDKEAEDIEVSEPAPETVAKDDEPEESSTSEDAAAKDSSAAESKTAKTKDSREKLIESLTTGKEMGDDEEGESAEAEEPETAEDSEGAPAAKTDEQETTEDAAKTEPEEEAIDAPLPRGAKEDTQKRFSKLLNERKENKPYTDYGKSMFEFMKGAGLEPNDVGFLLNMGGRIKKDPAAAAAEVYEFAKNIAAKHGAKLPEAVKVERQVPDELLIALDEILTDSVVAAEVTPEVVKKIRAEVRKHKAAAALPIVTPTPSQPSPTPQQAPAPVQQLPPGMNPQAVRAAGDELAQVQAEYAKAMPADWAKLKPQIDKTMEKYAGTQPHQWAGFYRTEIELARAKIIQARPPTPPKALRPSNASTPNQNNPRADALAILTGRKT